MPRPKGSKKEKIQSLSRTSISSFLLSSNDETNWFIKSIDNLFSINRTCRARKIEFNQSNDETNISEQTAGRVVVNPAVLRYLEYNRTHSNTLKTNEFLTRNLSIDEHEQSDLSDYSTEFLTSIQLAQWILMQSYLKSNSK